MPHLPLMQELLIQLPPPSRGLALREASLDVFRIAGITAALEAGRGIELDRAEAELLLTAILRQVSINDTTFGKVAAEVGIDLSSKSTADVVVSVPFMKASGGQRQLPITELAASSMLMWEISLSVKKVLEGIGVKESLEPPEVTVRAGSISFSFGGGTLLVSGIGLVIAAHAALPPGDATMISCWGGSIISMLGIMDLVFGWKKVLAEADKLSAEARKLEAEGQKITAEAKKIETELLLNAAHERLEKRDEARASSQPRLASALLDRQETMLQAKQYGISPALATHLVNRVLPTVAEATQDGRAKITSSLGLSSRQAAASV